MLDYEFWKLVPRDVNICITRIPVTSTKLTLQAAQDLSSLERIREAANTLHATKPNVVTYACTVGSFIKGASFLKDILQILSKTVGCPASTTSTALVEALKELRIRKLGIISPYIYEISIRLKSFIEVYGIEVSEMEILSLEYGFESLTSDFLFEKTLKVAKKPVDAVFISCTGVPTMEILVPLEKKLGKPVLTANQVTIWHALKRIGIRFSGNNYL